MQSGCPIAIWPTAKRFLGPKAGRGRNLRFGRFPASHGDCPLFTLIKRNIALHPGNTIGRISARPTRNPILCREKDLHAAEPDGHFTMQIVDFSTLDELAPYADAWDRLAGGVPFRTWDWMSTWWRHYGRSLVDSSRGRLAVLAAFDNSDVLVGIAPWYLETGTSQGNVLRWLGSGEVCSDYLSILCHPSAQNRVTEAMADYLTGRSLEDRGCFDWDLIDLDGVDAADAPIDRLLGHMADRDCLIHCRSAVNCWRIEMPATWDQYLALLSKSHRKQLRRCHRNVFDTDRAMLHTVENCRQLDHVIDLLIDLHQRRRRAIGQRGCFASKTFTAFHREVMPLMLAAGKLQLHWLELDQQPVAAEYHMTGNGIVYAYQAGVEPDMLDQEPGRLITMATLQRAIGQGRRAVDFLRGDEPYKAHFRAEPRPSLSLRIVRNRPVARLRHNLWLAGSSLGRWVKACSGLTQHE